MLHLSLSSPADLAMSHLARLATTPGITPRQMARATGGTLDAWQEMPEGRQHAMELRTMLASKLAGAIERVDTLQLAEKQQAQNVVNALREGVEALGDRLAIW